MQLRKKINVFIFKLSHPLLFSLALALGHNGHCFSPGLEMLFVKGQIDSE